MTVERTPSGFLPWTTKLDLRPPEASPGPVMGPNTAGERPRVLFGSAVPNSPCNSAYERWKIWHSAAAYTPAELLEAGKYALFKDDFERILHATSNNNFHSTRKELLKREGLSTIIAMAGSRGDSRDGFVENMTRLAEDVASGGFLLVDGNVRLLLSTIIAIAGSAGDCSDGFVENMTQRAEDVASGGFLSDADPTNNGISVVGRNTAGPGADKLPRNDVPTRAVIGAASFGEMVDLIIEASDGQRVTDIVIGTYASPSVLYFPDGFADLSTDEDREQILRLKEVVQPGAQIYFYGIGLANDEASAALMQTLADELGVRIFANGLGLGVLRFAKVEIGIPEQAQTNGARAFYPRPLPPDEATESSPSTLSEPWPNTFP